MEKNLIIKAIKTRLKYLDIIGGTESCSVQSVDEMVSNIFNSSEELMAFKNCKPENIGELKRLSIELCADIMIMLHKVDDFVPPMFGREFVIPKNTPKFPNGGLVEPGFPKGFDPTLCQVGSLSLLNEVLSGKIAESAIKGESISISSEGVVNDPYSAFRDDYEHMVKIVKRLSNGDTACINGLVDIIIKEQRSGIAIEMLKMDLRGRAYCLGFTAKLCKCKISNMDALINAYREGVITSSDIKIECMEGRGKRFSAAYIFDNYK